MELRLQNNGGLASAVQQIRSQNYIDPFKDGKRAQSSRSRCCIGRLGQGAGGIEGGGVRTFRM